MATVAKTDGNGNVTERDYPGYVEKNGKTYNIVTNNLGRLMAEVNVDTGEVAATYDWDEL